MDEATKWTCWASWDGALEELADPLTASSRAWDLWPLAEIIPHFQGDLPVPGRGVWALPSPSSQLKMGIFPHESSWYPSPLPGLGSIGVCGFCFW